MFKIHKTIIVVISTVIFANSLKPTASYTSSAFEYTHGVNTWVSKALLGHASTLYANYLWLQLNQTAEIGNSSRMLNRTVIKNMAYDLVVYDANFYEAHRYTTSLLSSLFDQADDSVAILCMAYLQASNRLLDDIIFTALVYDIDVTPACEVPQMKNSISLHHQQEYKIASLNWLITKTRNKMLIKYLKIRLEHLENSK